MASRRASHQLQDSGCTHIRHSHHFAAVYCATGDGACLGEAETWSKSENARLLDKMMTANVAKW